MVICTVNSRRFTLRPAKDEGPSLLTLNPDPRPSLVSPLECAALHAIRQCPPPYTLHPKPFQMHTYASQPCIPFRMNTYRLSSKPYKTQLLQLLSLPHLQTSPLQVLYLPQIHKTWGVGEVRCGKPPYPARIGSPACPERSRREEPSAVLAPRMLLRGDEWISLSTFDYQLSTVSRRCPSLPIDLPTSLPPSPMSRLFSPMRLMERPQ